MFPPLRRFAAVLLLVPPVCARRGASYFPLSAGCYLLGASVGNGISIISSHLSTRAAAEGCHRGAAAHPRQSYSPIRRLMPIASKMSLYVALCVKLSGSR
jgi:hypothetical protein